MSSRRSKVLITTVVAATFLWRGYVLFFTSADPYDGHSAGAWVVMWGVFLLLRGTWWKQSSDDGLVPGQSPSSGPAGF